MNDTLFGFSFTISPVVTSGIILFAAVWLVLSILGDVWSFFEKKEPPAHHELGAVVAAQTLVASMIAENEFRAFIGERPTYVAKDFLRVYAQHGLDAYALKEGA